MTDHSLRVTVKLVSDDKAVDLSIKMTTGKRGFVVSGTTSTQQCPHFSAPYK